MDELYRDFILDHYRNPRNSGTLENPDASFEDINPLCGDKIRMDLKLKDGVVTDVKFKGRGCAISQASASLLTEQIKGKTLEEINKIGKEDVLENVGINISAARLKCALLGLKVLKSALALKYLDEPS
ncbi:MAG: SUF system NifU family Fe-S cluster assembly protein [Candidatus Eremiobacteraeota bacterium]|nr:SUF system NifU family Fe-S cluster assembly protein [Candidatus Eremiobacteraeota bacterium]MBV8221841.1 SUF system NifU family Fe-S cluster assembly protein [Candidatus Eremiobacteraeota bacterium]MBV8281007.1 SUF system NifU family Fe-S cluster assembly protein [Candidatus Eremiobacteraeota bacterium]